MEIRYHKHFTKAFLKLSPKIRKKVKETIDVFQNNPHHPQLDNHALHGKDQGKQAISAGGDLRIVFEEDGNYEIVTLLRVGTHNQVY